MKLVYKIMISILAICTVVVYYNITQLDKKAAEKAAEKAAARAK